MVSRGRDQRMLKGVEPQVEVLLSDLQVEEMTSGTIKASTLRWWRHLNNGTGPRWFKLGPRRVVYRRSDVVAWLDSQYDAGVASIG